MASTGSITIKTENEGILFKYYTEEKAERERIQEFYLKEKAERQKLQSLVTDLTGRIEELQNQLQGLQEQKKPVNSNIEKPSESVNYETDEEELARETEWVRSKTRKKRKLNASLSPQLPGSIENRDGPKVKKAPLPPPIIVENIKNYQQFYDLLLASVPKDTFVGKMMNGESVKINANNEDSYRAIREILLKNNCLWYSYENKQDRPIRVMAKNLHSSCLPERILEDLASKGLEILEAVNKLSWKGKEPLNMFMLSFKKDEDVSKIYNIKTILGCKVDIQPLKTSKLIPQCKRCQAYGHTQKYCSKEPRCVKCTGKHLTKDCRKPADAKPKCIHCGEPHPASYRGCTVAKELQNIKNKVTKKKVLPATNPTTQVPRTNRKLSVHQPVTKNLTFAQITKGAKPQPQPPTKSAINSNTDEKLNTILNLLSSFDERLKKLESTKTATFKQKP